MECEFSLPINLGNEEAPDWEYSALNCTSSQEQMFELIEDPLNPEVKFYLSKTVSYFGIWCYFIITVSLFFLIGREVVNYLWKK